jgi:hypothetical protein
MTRPTIHDEFIALAVPSTLKSDVQEMANNRGVSLSAFVRMALMNLATTHKERKLKERKEQWGF